MTRTDSVSGWIRALQAGEREAVAPLWDRFARRLLGLAHRVLITSNGRMADEEDVALSAFDSFCRRLEGGRFPLLTNRDDLWRVLSFITWRKAIDHVHHERRRTPPGHPVEVADEVPAREPEPAEIVVAAECLERLIGCLGSPELKSIVLWKLDGYTNGEIAGQLGCTRRTVERKLVLIRKTWSREFMR